VRLEIVELRRSGETTALNLRLTVVDGAAADANVAPRSEARSTGGAPLLLSATFGAPPPDVDALDVVIPRFGTFEDVPLP